MLLLLLRFALWFGLYYRQYIVIPVLCFDSVLYISIVGSHLLVEEQQKMREQKR